MPRYVVPQKKHTAARARYGLNRGCRDNFQRSILMAGLQQNLCGDAWALRHLRAGEAEAEARAAAGFGFHPHIAAVLQDGLAGERQSQAEAVAFTGGNEGLK